MNDECTMATDEEKRKLNDALSLPANTVSRAEWGSDVSETFLTHFGVDFPVDHVLVTTTGSAPCHTLEDCCREVKELEVRDREQEKLRDIKQKWGRKLLRGEGLAN